MGDNGGNGVTISSGQLHELRNRLTVVKGVAQLLDRHAQNGDERMSDIVVRTEALLVEIEALAAAVAEITLPPVSEPIHRGAPDSSNGN